MMKRIAAAALALLFVAQIATADDWAIDPAHTSVGFAVKHMVISTVHGKFDTFDGTVSWDGKDVATGSVKFTIDAKSINTGSEYRDNDLRSPNFFDVEKFPKIEFASKKVIPGTDNQFKLVGDLTLHGVTKEVTFDCELGGTAVDGRGNTHAGFSAKTKINRQDFGVVWSKALEGGGLVAGNDVDISLDVEVVKPKA